jgi:type I restriction enzyme S subunit
MEKLRFKDIDGNKYPEWDENMISDLELYISDGNYGEKYPRAENFISSGVPFIRANNIKNLKVDYKDMRYISKDLHKELTSGHLKKNDIIITTRGEIGELALVSLDDEGANINAQICLIRIEQNNLDPKYVINNLSSRKVKAQIRAVQAGSALKQLPKGQLGKIKIDIPSLAEQAKIGGFLSAIDVLVDKQREKVGLLKKIKKGYLQKIFSKELRFKDECGNDYSEWENSNLGLISDLITKGTTPKQYTNSGVNFIKVESLKNGDINLKMCAKISKNTNDNELKRSRLKENDLLFSIAGTLGRTAFVSKQVIPANTNQALSIIRLKKNIINRDYLTSNIYDSKVNRYVYENVTVGAQPNLNLEQVSKFPIEKASLSEQEKIGGFLCMLDKNVNDQECKLERYEQMKEGYMQRLFA